MRSPRRGGRKDDWGRRSRDPLISWLQADPKRGALVSAGVTVGLILFWIMVVLGLIVFILVKLS